MAETSGHNKEMEDLMRAKELMSGIEERKLQCVDNTSDGIDHTSGNQPDKCCVNSALVVCAMTFAIVVFPVPGGP